MVSKQDKWNPRRREKTAVLLTNFTNQMVICEPLQYVRLKHVLATVTFIQHWHVSRNKLSAVT